MRFQETVIGAIQAEIPDDSAHPEQIIGSYRLRRQLGRGGMGVVWEAEQIDTGRHVAVKLMRRDSTLTEHSIDRFIREGRIAASLSHPRTTFVLGSGQHVGQPYIVMELMPGKTLQDVVEQEGPLPVTRAVDYILDVIEGLEAAHALGVIHRDVKPSNCFLDHDGRVKVGDFGLSKSLVSDAKLTQTGTFMGTPQFAAPEQVRNIPADERTDQYSLGATLFYLLAQRGPFAGDAVAMIAQIASDSPASLHDLRPEVPKTLDRIIARTLEKQPDRRFPDLAQLREQILPFATGGTSIPVQWRRFAAWMLDHLILSLFAYAVFWIANVAAGNSMGIEAILASVITAIATIAYFAIAEGQWGRGVGKLVTRLHVSRVNGERVGWNRSFLRALIIPGALGIPILIQLWSVYLYATGTPENEVVRTQIASSLAFGLPTTLFLLFCLVTMRRRNGYRGLHEFASGTHVVQLATPRETIGPSDVPIVAPVAVPQSDNTVGPFHVVGELGRVGALAVLVAQDDLLGRTVWLQVDEGGGRPLDEARRGVARPTRPHWLQGGEVGHSRWEAFEAVFGVPVSEYAKHGRRLTWDRGRPFLLELAQELSTAAKDLTLPTPVTLQQVWIDRNGRTKLLDVPLAATNENTEAFLENVKSPQEQAVEVLRGAASLCARGQVLPEHVQSFLIELDNRTAEADTLDWAAAQLAHSSDAPTRVTWTHRLGALSVSMCVEVYAYLLLSLILPLIGLVIAPVLGAVLTGGPAFKVTGIQVRRRDGRHASRLRCACRSMVAWGPLLLPFSFMGVVAWIIIASWLGSPDAQSTDAAASIRITPDSPAWSISRENIYMFVVCMMSLGLGMLLSCLGAIVCVVNPQRGLQDVLAGTALVPCSREVGVVGETPRG